jgi:hypothetical protein
MVEETSPGSGNLPVRNFEKTVSPSTVTSKTPPPLLTSVGLTPNSFSSSAASPAARGW